MFYSYWNILRNNKDHWRWNGFILGSRSPNRTSFERSYQCVLVHVYEVDFLDNEANVKAFADKIIINTLADFSQSLTQINTLVTYVNKKICLVTGRACYNWILILFYVTVPANFHEVLRSYTQHGYRVLAVAWKQLPAKYNYVRVQRIQR